MNFTLRKVMHISLIAIIIVLILYLIYAIYISFTLNNIIKKAINDENYDSNLNYIINEDNFELMNPRQPESEENFLVETEGSNTFPLVLPFITNAYYAFSYSVFDVKTDEIIYGTPLGHVTVRLKYNSFPCYIEDVEVAP